MNWLAASLIVLGYFFTIWKNKWGFIIQMVGCTIYIFSMLYIDLSIVFVNGVFWLSGLLGFIKWHLEGEVITEGGDIVVNEVEK